MKASPLVFVQHNDDPMPWFFRGVPRSANNCGKVVLMAATGEECFHQKTIHYYFDSDYDLNFDAEAQHYCQRFNEMVIPAKRCGTSCPAFQPLRQTSSFARTKTAETNDELANDSRVRAFLRHQLDVICSEVERNAQYLERQFSERQRRWREMDEWLSQPDTSPEVLGNAVAASQRRLSLALNALQRVCQRLDSARSKLKDVRDLERLWLEQEQCEQEVQLARRNLKQAQDKLSEREKRQTEQNRLYAKWEDALERVPLLRQLRDVTVRHVESWLADTQQPLSDAGIERIVRFLQGVVAYSIDDVRLSTLRNVIEYLDSM